MERGQSSMELVFFARRASHLKEVKVSRSFKDDKTGSQAKSLCHFPATLKRSYIPARALASDMTETVVFGRWYLIYVLCS